MTAESEGATSGSRAASCAVVAALKAAKEPTQASSARRNSQDPLTKLDEAVFTSNGVPEACKGVPCCLGIDEAGRGAVLGSMFYGATFWPISQNDEIEKLGFDDSKALKEGERERLHEGILKESDRIGWVVCELTAVMISAQMLQRTPKSLNKMSHDAAIAMIQMTLDAGVDVKEIYVDTVGNAEWYAERLNRLFGHAAHVTVCAKADSLYKVVSAASICAKVTRDRSIKDWKHPEERRGAKFDVITGSGYPGDERSRAWLAENTDAVFGYPSVVRFSWGTIKSILEPDVVAEAQSAPSSSTEGYQGAKPIVPTKRLLDVEWEEEGNAERRCMMAFMQPASSRPAKRVASFLTSRGFSISNDIASF